jgi:hypothetical protein
MLISNIAPALNNGAAIMTAYDVLPLPSFSSASGTKWESPISSSVQVLGQTISALTATGEKYMLLVATSGGDYCDDTIDLCPMDSTVYRIQANKAAGITTIVLGIDIPTFNTAPGTLQALANAGAGEPTLATLPLGQTDPAAFYDICQGVTPWRNDVIAAGKTIARGNSAGIYAAAAGPSHAYTASAADQAAIAARLKSCTFDLGGSLSVDQSKLNLAHIKIAGTDVPLDATNGWNMPTDTRVVLNGTSCATWRSPASQTIDFQFPCETILVH